MKDQTLKKETMWTPLFTAAFIINFLNHFTTYALNNLCSLLADSLGAGEAVIGGVASAFAITALVFKMISAPMIDTYNRKWILFGSTVCIGLASACFAIADTVAMMIVARLLQGAAVAFTTTCCLTVASDGLPQSKMSSGVGFFALGTAIAQAISPKAALALQDKFGFATTYWVFTGVIVLNLVFIAVTKMENNNVGKKFHFSISGIIAKEAIIPAVIIFLFATAFTCINAFLTVDAVTSRGFAKSDIGNYFTIYAITLLATRPIIGKLCDRFGTVKVVIPSSICFIASFFIISYASNIWMYYIAAFISAFGYGGAQPAIQAIGMKSVPKERRGAASCTVYIGSDTAHFMNSISGVIAAAWGYEVMWRVMTIPVVLGAILVFVFRSQINKADALKKA